MNTHRPDDESLPGEDELAALYRKLPRKEPGPALDEAVLRAAARAVGSATPVPMARRRARWPVALGSAAVLVLVAGLGWRMRDMPANAPPAAPAAVAVQEKAMPATTPAAARKSANEPLTADTTVTAEAVPPPPARPPAQRAIAAKLQKPAAALPNEVAAERQADAQGSVASNYAADMAPAPAPRAQPPAPETRTFAAPAPQRLVTVAPAMAPAPAPAAAPSTDTARNAADTPDQELDKIRHLFSANHRDEARQRLADFHRDHPDYPLPNDLRDQLLTP